MRGTVRYDGGGGIPKEVAGRIKPTGLECDHCFVPVLKVYEDKRGEWGSPAVHTIPWDRVIYIKERQ